MFPLLKKIAGSTVSEFLIYHSFRSTLGNNELTIFHPYGLLDRKLRVGNCYFSYVDRTYNTKNSIDRFPSKSF